MFTEGDSRYIKRHTEKSFRELNIKGVKMKSTKKRPAKRTDNPIIGKLLKLKYRINEAFRSGNYDDAYNDTQADKAYVMNLISDIRRHNFEKLAPEDVHCCNGLWRKYE
jgi:hypothetical protein